MEHLINDYDKKMTLMIEKGKTEISKLKTNYIHPSLLADVKFDYFGSKIPISQISKINMGKGKELIVKPYDKNIIQGICAAIAKTDLGLNPQNNGDFICVPIPQLTEDTRKEIVKKLKKIIEFYKISIRNIRRSANNAFKKDKTLSKNQFADLEERIQKLTDEKIKLLSDMEVKKEKQIMTV